MENTRPDTIYAFTAYLSFAQMHIAMCICAEQWNNEKLDNLHCLVFHFVSVLISARKQIHPDRHNYLAWVNI